MFLKHEEKNEYVPGMSVVAVVFCRQILKNQQFQAKFSVF